MSNVETRVHSFIHKYYNLYSLWRNMASLLTIYYDNYTMVLARVVFFLLSKLLFFFSLSGFDYYFSGRLHARSNWPIRITGDRWWWTCSKNYYRLTGCPYE